MISTIIKYFCKTVFVFIKYFLGYVFKTLIWLWSYTWVRILTLVAILASLLTIRESSIGFFIFPTTNYNTITFTQPCKITNIFEKDVKTQIKLLKNKI